MEYTTDYRNTSLMLPGMVVLLVAYLGFAGFALISLEPSTAMAAFLWSTVATIVALAILVTAGYRVHYWRLEPDHLFIRERPKLRFAGRQREFKIPYGTIAAMEERENVRDRYLDIVCTSGRRHRLPQALVTGRGLGAGMPDPSRDLGLFMMEMKAVARRAGVDLPGSRDMLGFFATVPGILVLFAVLLLTLVLAGALIWAEFHGFERRPGKSSAEAYVLVMALPIGAAWLIVRAWRQRRYVLRRQDRSDDGP